ncbi:HNH endonuclease [Treponema denticola]|uniref:HNH endonuclease n=1 Tax=Treponema denticola TaxID=158 RepID=UPI0005D27BDC|nr:HNH endonuclease [Treponema denticola]
MKDLYNSMSSAEKEKYQREMRKQFNEAGNRYRDEYLRRYSPPYECKMHEKVFQEASCDRTVDHIIPQPFGGTNVMTNLQILCQSCNSKKKAVKYFSSKMESLV